MNEVSTDKLENELSEVSDINDYLKKNSEFFVSVKLSAHRNARLLRINGIQGPQKQRFLL